MALIVARSVGRVFYIRIIIAVIESNANDPSLLQRKRIGWYMVTRFRFLAAIF